MVKRKCFESDEDGHWYLINIEEKKLFNKLLEDEYEEYTGKFEEKFGNCRLGMHISNYSFLDCEEIK